MLMFPHRLEASFEFLDIIVLAPSSAITNLSPSHDTTIEPLAGFVIHPPSRPLEPTQPTDAFHTFDVDPSFFESVFILVISTSGTDTL